MRAKISTKTVNALYPGETIADTEVRGFSARRWPSGAVSFDLRYRTVSGERRRLSLGLHGSITADEARKLAKKRAGEVADDRDPVAERKTIAATAGNTVNVLLDNYIKRYLNTKRSAAVQISAFNRLVRPRIGERSIYSLTRGDIAQLFDWIEDNSGPVAADCTLAYLRKAFHWQQTRDQDFVSPIIRGMARTSAKERARSRTLTDDELRAIWKATQEPNSYHAFIRFLLLTAARRDEAGFLTWDEIKGGDWTLPAARNKVKVDLVRPLSKAVRDMLAALPHDSIYVFAGRKGPLGAHTFRKTRLDKASGVTGWWLHDLRRTARSLMSRAGVPTDHAERCLGHVIGGVRGTYDRHLYRTEMAAAYERLARQVKAIVRN
jgi:integrase